jgi:CyaY protein
MFLIMLFNLARGPRGLFTVTDSEFLTLADSVLQAIEAACEAAGDTGLEASRSANVLTIELDDGSRIVVNSQAPARQIWVAARNGGYHYAWRDGCWLDTRDGSELFAALSRIVSQQSGTAVDLRP